MLTGIVGKQACVFLPCIINLVLLVSGYCWVASPVPWAEDAFAQLEGAVGYLFVGPCEVKVPVAANVLLQIKGRARRRSWEAAGLEEAGAGSVPGAQQVLRGGGKMRSVL